VRLLVVDDDRVFREELGELLRDDGHSVAVEGSVAKALEALGAAEFDVVLTDLKMPRTSGMELLREVRARWPRTLVVMITGFATIETALEAMKAGAFDYVRKPFRLDQVRETLRLADQEREFEAPPGSAREPVVEARNLAADGAHEILFLGDPPPAAEPHLHTAPLTPQDLAGIADRCRAFLADHPNGGIVIAGAERLVAVHRLEDVVALFGQLRGALAGRGPLRVAFNPRRVPASVATALAGSVAPEETHATLEALANPIRRSVLQRLLEGPAPFSEAMRAAGLDDSPKISFHLRKLVEAGLLRHDGELYRLTARGEAAVALLRDAAFLPPSSDADNLAFPRGGGGSRRSPP
jgi:DNA-binding response OmpR family regulator/DNA-binding transcriptional ArsR family regulator